MNEITVTNELEIRVVRVFDVPQVVGATARSQLPPWACGSSPTGSVLEELPQVPGVAASSVQGILPRRFAAISLRSAGSQTRTVSAWASATRAVIAAGP